MLRGNNGKDTATSKKKRNEHDTEKWLRDMQNKC